MQESAAYRMVCRPTMDPAARADIRELLADATRCACGDGPPTGPGSPCVGGIESGGAVGPLGAGTGASLGGASGGTWTSRHVGCEDRPTTDSQPRRDIVTVTELSQQRRCATAAALS